MLPAMTVQGHAEFLLHQSNQRAAASVVIANDVRTFSDIAGRYRRVTTNPLLGLSSWTLARLAAEIYAANGILVFLAALGDNDAVLTTPELSFAIRELSAQGGVNFSASHNHPDDNGIKIYDQRGAQPVAADVPVQTAGGDHLRQRGLLDHP